MGKITGGKAVATLLTEYGISRVFGVPGGQTYPIYVGIAELSPKIEHVGFRCERCAAMAADAWARVTGLPGVCDGAPGPGATNLLPGVSEAFEASIPMLVITSDVDSKLSGRNAMQEIDQITMMKPFVKASFNVTRRERVPESVREAFRIATTGRPRPVQLNFPSDVLWGEWDYGEDLFGEPEYGTFPAKRVAPISADIEKAAQAILKAQKPVIFAGGGVISSHAEKELIGLAELLGIPVATTIHGKGAIEDSHPLSIGAVSTVYHPENVFYARGVELVLDCDLAIFIGTRTSQVSTANWTAPRHGTPAVQIDIDPAEIGRNYPAAAGIVGDVKLALRALVEELNTLVRNKPLSEILRARQVQEIVKAWRDEVAPELNSDCVPITTHRVVKEINELLGTDSIFVCDASLATYWGATYFDTKAVGRTFVCPRGVGGIGQGLPMTIGAKVAAPDKVVVGLGGDGGFAYALHELETMIRLNTPATFVVINNSCFAYIRNVSNMGYPVVSCDFTPLNYARIAEAFGCYGVRVERPDEIRDAIESAIQSGKPAVVDVVTAYDFPTRKGAAVLEGTWGQA